MTKTLLPRFLVTAELSRLARWLRLLGFDTSVAGSGQLRDWVRICSMQNRVLLTRVRKNMRLQVVKHFIVIESDRHLEQLKQVISNLELNNFQIFSRCLYCNRAVYPITKDRILNKLPEKVKQREEHFTHCRKCGRIYWKGTHFEAMLHTLKETLPNYTSKQINGFVLTDLS